MSVQQTSLLALKTITDSGKLPESRRAVFELIKANPGICDKEIAVKLGWSINRVTPRRNELLKGDYIEAIAYKTLHGFKQTAWVAVR
jgi:predicted transcriptional regulator